MKYICHSLDDLDHWATQFLENLKPQKTATIVSLSGELGAGKTALVQILAKKLGITETVTSPTFVIQKEYSVPDHLWIQQLVHIDAYRLEDKSELEYLGWEELIQTPNTLVCIEWPEKVSGIALPHRYEIILQITKNQAREIILKKHP